MVENVFILGAGASFDSGAPLMGNFLDAAEELLTSNLIGPESDAFKLVFSIISELQVVHSKSYLQLDNIETLFGAIEMARIINRLGVRTGESIESARDALIKLIVTTLEKSIRLPVSNSRVNPTRSYLEFVELINDLNIDNKIKSSVITFNYDVALDYAFNFTRQTVDYRLTPTTNNHAINYLKLHGSINWGRCKKCGEIVPYYFSNYFNKYRWDMLFEETRSVLLAPSGHLSDLNHCETNIENLPVIVPPTWNKTDYQGTLTRVWSQAAADLQSARNIYVFGYSLPESDAFFRYLFALGTAGESRIKRFIVFDPNSTGEVKRRYESLVGRGISNRFEYVELEFSNAVKHLRNILDVKKKNY